MLLRHRAAHPRESPELRRALRILLRNRGRAHRVQRVPRYVRGNGVTGRPGDAGRSVLLLPRSPRDHAPLRRSGVLRVVSLHVPLAERRLLRAARRGHLHRRRKASLSLRALLQAHARRQEGRPPRGSPPTRLHAGILPRESRNAPRSAAATGRSGKNRWNSRGETEFYGKIHGEFRWNSRGKIEFYGEGSFAGGSVRVPAGDLSRVRVRVRGAADQPGNGFGGKPAGPLREHPQGGNAQRGASSACNAFNACNEHIERIERIDIISIVPFIFFFFCFRARVRFGFCVQSEEFQTAGRRPLETWNRGSHRGEAGNRGAARGLRVGRVPAAGYPREYASLRGVRDGSARSMRGFTADPSAGPVRPREMYPPIAGVSSADFVCSMCLLGSIGLERQVAAFLRAVPASHVPSPHACCFVCGGRTGYFVLTVDGVLVHKKCGLLLRGSVYSTLHSQMMTEISPIFRSPSAEERTLVQFVLPAVDCMGLQSNARSDPRGGVRNRPNAALRRPIRCFECGETSGQFVKCSITNCGNVETGATCDVVRASGVSFPPNLLLLQVPR